MSFEITGTLVRKYETETKGESFRIRDFVIKTENGQYDNFVKFQTTQDRTDIIESYVEGEEIKVHFDLRGRQWQDKYFTNLNAWRVERVGSAAAPATAATSSRRRQPVGDPDKLVAEAEDDDLPF